jgi:hypothetical protein
MGEWMPLPCGTLAVSATALACINLGCPARCVLPLLSGFSR